MVEEKIQCRLLSYKVFNNIERNVNNFHIQMFGLDEKGKSYSINVLNFKPYFFVKVGDHWTNSYTKKFMKLIHKKCAKMELGKKYDDYKSGKKQKIYPSLPKDREEMSRSEYIIENIDNGYKSRIENNKDILECKMYKRKTLYGFDRDKNYKFIYIQFRNTTVFNKIKDFWYKYVVDKTERFGRKSYLQTLKIMDCETELYESNIPPLLRYFHIREISPSGWIEMNKDDIYLKEKNRNKTNCDYDLEIEFDKIKSLPYKETGIPLKVCSYDIEASSSHGDFPVPKKSYRKWVGELITYWHKHEKEIRKKSKLENIKLFKELYLCAFNYKCKNKEGNECFIKKRIDGISEVYPKWDKNNITRDILMRKIGPFIKLPIYNIIVRDKRRIKFEEKKEKSFSKEEVKSESDYNDIREYKNYIRKKSTFIDYLNDFGLDKLKKLDILDEATEFLKFEKRRSKYNLIPLEGDKVTFIGSTFMRIDEDEPYLNHGICLGDCEEDMDIGFGRCEIECYNDERDILIKWSEMIRREKPDVIIGYNIFGFDWRFMCDRAEELECESEFSKIGRNNIVPELYRIKKEKSIRIASGTHNLTYIELDGIIQIDLYNYFRREVNLSSYKLQDVGSHFIGDKIKKIEILDEDKKSKNKMNDMKKTKVYSGNLMGLNVGNYVCFDILGHSNDHYRDGKKFKVIDMSDDKKSYIIEGDLSDIKDKKLRWGLGKDDVSVLDLFKAFSKTGTKDDRTKIAKYCFQDCNLVHHLFKKNDIWTGMVEQSKICSVPIDFIIMRGQGIKLLSFIAKKCREKDTLMPVLQKAENDGSYEGAICLKPRRGFYNDENPVAVVDYAALYPSSMISENISHDSKVWTKEYDLKKKLIKEWGIKNDDGDYIYDNLEGYQYVDVEYDMYEWIRKSEKSKEEKVKVGVKVCRFAQFPNNKKAIMPSILQGLLAARKATRVNSKYKTIKTNDDKIYSGLISEDEKTYKILDISLEDEKLKKTINIVNKEDVIYGPKDTYTQFMKNVYNQRQLSIKVVANSLYGQCGARTSAFYEKDIAASTTATGRKLLIYAKKIIEKVYHNKIVDTKYGKIKCNAECVYGDSVTADTPLLLKNKKTGLIEIKIISELSKLWYSYEGFKMGEKKRRNKQQSKCNEYLIYTSKGWSNIKKVIRHKTIKKIYRVMTHKGIVDVTEDHSLLNENLQPIKPRKVRSTTKLFHKYPKSEYKPNIFNLIKIEFILHRNYDQKKAFIMGYILENGYYNKESFGLFVLKRNIANLFKNIILSLFELDGCVITYNKVLKLYKLEFTNRILNYFRKIYSHKNYRNFVGNYYLNCEDSIKLAYLSGYIYSKNQNIKKESKNINKEKYAGLYYIANSLNLQSHFEDNIFKINYKKCLYSRKYNTHVKYKKKITYDEYVYDIETETGNFNCGFPLIVKNTDSCFQVFNLIDMEGNKIVGKKALDITIQLAIEAGELATKFLKPPHDLEYEKTFMPFLLLSKKRYVGMLYEHDINKCKNKSMGIVLKRRDNANIVKDCYGGIINIMMSSQNVNEAVKFTRNFLVDMVNEKFPLDKLIISKSLRGFYKNPESIAHYVLAERMGKRDAGNKPSVGSRIPYVFIQTKKNVKLQGDKIESPAYIKKMGLKPDYGYYITNQIMKPVMQIFALLLEVIPEFKIYKMELNNKIKFINIKYKDDEKKRIQKEDELRNKYVKKIVFESAIRQANNKKSGQKTIESFFG